MFILNFIFNRAESILFFICFFGVHYGFLKYLLSKPHINSYPVLTFFIILTSAVLVTLLFIYAWFRCSYYLANFRERIIEALVSH